MDPRRSGHQSSPTQAAAPTLAHDLSAHHIHQVVYELGNKTEAMIVQIAWAPRQLQRLDNAFYDLPSTWAHGGQTVTAELCRQSTTITKTNEHVQEIATSDEEGH